MLFPYYFTFVVSFAIFFLIRSFLSMLVFSTYVLLKNIYDNFSYSKKS